MSLYIAFHSTILHLLRRYHAASNSISYGVIIIKTIVYYIIHLILRTYVSTYIYILHRFAYYTNLKRYDTNMFRNLTTISPTLRSSSDAVQAICCFQMAAKEATDAQALHTRRCGAWQASQRTREVDNNNVYSHSRSVFMPNFFARSKSIVYKIKI